MSLSYSKKNKCQGCEALRSSSNGYQCALNFNMTFTMLNGKPWQPVPLEKCLKPKSLKELAEAKRRLKEKAESEA